MEEEMVMDGSSKMISKDHVPKQFDIDKLMSIEKTERDILIKLITSRNNMFHEEVKTTIRSYDLIIDQREGRINNLLK